MIDFREIYNSNFLSFPPSSVMILVAFFVVVFLSSFFFVKDQIASFQLKQIVVVLKCRVCVISSLRDSVRV